MDIKELTLKNLMTDRPDLVEAIKAGEDEGTVISFVEKGKDGKITRWTEEKRDLDGKLISKRVDDYTYSENGDVDQISLKEYNEKEIKTSEKIVKHGKNEEPKKL